MIVRPDPTEFAVTMTHWSVREIFIESLNKHSRHLCGLIDKVEGRVCSPILSFDQNTMSFITRSGKFYEVQGNPGSHPDSEYVWAMWCTGNRVEDANYRDVTNEYIIKED